MKSTNVTNHSIQCVKTNQLFRTKTKPRQFCLTVTNASMSTHGYNTGTPIRPDPNRSNAVRMEPSLLPPVPPTLTHSRYYMLNDVARQLSEKYRSTQVESPNQTKSL